MRALLEALGHPERSFESIHVVGTNGKTSVTTIAAALLEGHGVRSGAYVSPHLGGWEERLLLPPTGFSGISSDEATESLTDRRKIHAEAVQRTAQAAEAIGGGPAGPEPISQFEIATAAAFVALEAAGVDVAVIEAGLGGRLDATNVLDAPVCVLTSVDLDHVEWLGEDVASIAAEKLAVAPEGATLVCGELAPEVWALVRVVEAERRLTVVAAPGAPEGAEIPEGVSLFQRHNLAIAGEAVRAALGRLDPAVLSEVARSVSVPGRMEVIEGDPPEIRDAAHNPAAIRALVESLPGATGGRPLFGLVAVLADKDAEAMARAIAPALEGVVCTELAGELGGGRRSETAAVLAGIFREAGVTDVAAVGDPREAWALCRHRAREAHGVALVAGSIYLLRALWTGKRDPSSSR